MKLIGVIDEAPFDPRTWSGASCYFFNAIDARGHLRTAVSAEPPAAERYLYQALSVQPDMARWKFRYHLNLGFYGAMTRAAARALNGIPATDYDAILQIGAWYDLPRISRKPVFSYHDGNLAVRLKSPYGYPAIARRHIQATLAYERDLYGRIRMLFPMSRWLADSFMADNGVEARRLLPVGVGINLPRVRPVDNKDYSAPRVLFVGKDFKRKGGPTLVEAFAAVRKEIPAAELIIIGPQLDGLPPGVTCLGTLMKTNDADIERLLDEYERASLFVMPSLYEPFGIVFGEAMAHKCPCIGTNICAMPEIIEHGKTGFVVPPSDSASLARHIVTLLKEPAMAREFGRLGYEKYRGHLTWDAVADKVCGAIAQQLGS